MRALERVRIDSVRCWLTLELMDRLRGWEEGWVSEVLTSSETSYELFESDLTRGMYRHVCFEKDLL